MSRLGARGRVLVADDDRLFRDVIAEYILGDPSLDLVGMAADADEAIRLAEFLQPDLALLDGKMPGGGGQGRRARSASARRALESWLCLVTRIPPAWWKCSGRVR